MKTFWNRYAQIIIVLLIAVDIPGVYLIFHLSREAYMDGFMGNWLATFLGVITGIPIALYFNRIQQEREEKRHHEQREWEERRQRKQQDEQERHQREQKKQEEKRRRDEETSRKREHESRLLNLLHKELNWNLEQVEAYKADPNLVRLPGFTDILWRALSDNGETRWIEDLRMLYTITQAYFYISTYIRLDNEHDRIHDAFPQYGLEQMKGMPGFARVIHARDMMYKYAPDWIRGAIEQIEARLNAIEPPKDSK